MSRNTKSVALGGVLAAVAIIIQCMGGLIPVATYVCPVLCMLILQAVVRLCGNRMGWAWYGAVAILGLLLGPDKEASAVFACLGYYPIIKPVLDRSRLRWLWKALLFNSVVLVMYALLIRVLGMEQIGQEFAALGTAMTVVTLVLGNMVFFLMDRILEKGRFGRK